MARIEVPMPQMGESIAEGTVSKWLKQLGETVERDEPILEISTDKVDAEIPSPASGTLVEISVAEGETVEVGTIVAFIDPDGAAPGAGAPAVPEAAVPAATTPTAEAPAPPPVAVAAAPSAGGRSAEERLRTRSTPVVRKIADEQGIDIANVPGTGHAGRVTKRDILNFIESGAGAVPPAASAAPAAPAAVTPAPAASIPVAAPAAPPSAPAAATAVSDLWAAFYGEVQHPE